MHNGDIKDLYVLRAHVYKTVDRRLAEDLIKGTSDSELVFALFMQQYLIEKAPAVASMRATIRILREQVAQAPCSMNFVMATPELIVSTRAINSDEEEASLALLLRGRGVLHAVLGAHHAVGRPGVDAGSEEPRSNLGTVAGIYFLVL
jgi:predicted glutamine amidotransferase